MGAPLHSSPRRGRRLLLWTVVSVVVLAVVAATAVVVALRLDKPQDEALPADIPPRPALVSVAPKIRPVSADAPAPTPTGVQRQLAAELRAPQLGELTGQISDAITGQILWSKGPLVPRIPASNDKVLSAAAYLLDLPHDQRITTTVVAGPGGQIILKGAGDPTLSAQPAGADTFYTDPGRIADLAEQITKSGVHVTSVAVDLDAFDGPTMDSTWDRRDIAGGDIAPIESAMVDGARIDPLDEFSPRSQTPGLSAGKALAKALGVDADVVATTAVPNARVLAKVQSAPLVTRVNDMLRYSDNVLAETLSIELSVHQGGPATLEGGVDAIGKTLSTAFADAWTPGTVLHDASGISYANRIPAALLDAVMTAASGPSQPKMRPMLDGLPIAGGTGTLSDRFDPKTNPGAGWVRAKTGTLTGVSSLTGIVQTVDGRVLSFAMMSGGTSPADARPALDDLVGQLRECGCR